MTMLNEMTVGELDATLTDVEVRLRTSVREGDPADDVAALESTAARISNELRRRRR